MKDIEVAEVVTVGLLSSYSGQSSCLGLLPVTRVRVTMYSITGRWNFGGLQEMLADTDVFETILIVTVPKPAAYVNSEHAGCKGN